MSCLMYRCTLSDNARTHGSKNLSRNLGDLSRNLSHNRPDHATNLANLALGILYLGHWFVVIPYTTLRMALLPKTLVWAKTLHGGASVEPALVDPTP